MWQVGILLSSKNFHVAGGYFLSFKNSNMGRGISLTSKGFKAGGGSFKL